MFELHDVWKSDKRKSAHKDAWAVSGATFILPAGRRIALLGKEDKVNTAVLRMLSGVDEPDKGVVRRLGQPCWPFDYAGVFENAATFAQNAGFLAQVYGVDSTQVVEIAHRLSGVRTTRGKPLSQYIAPERRALMLGMTLAFQFDWYFVDERMPKPPENNADEVEAVIEDRMGRASVVWATTRPEAVGGYCDAGLVLDQGTLTFYNDFGEAAEAFRQANESKVVKENDRKSRKTGRRRRAARRSGEIDTENAR